MTKFQLFTLKFIMMNAFFGNLAWIFYRFMLDVSVSTSLLYFERWWFVLIPTLIFFFGYSIFFIFDVVAYNYEFNVTYLPYLIFIIIFGGILSEKPIVNPPNMNGLIISCLLTMVTVTFLQKLGVFMFYFVRKHSCKPFKLMTKSSEI